MTEKEQYIQDSFLTPEIMGEKVPFQWGDEKDDFEKGNDGAEEDVKTYTSVAELLEDEEVAEIKRMEQYIQERFK